MKTQKFRLMTKTNFIFLIIIIISAVSCNKENDFPIDKRYWDTLDYADAIRKLKFIDTSEKELPKFDNPDTRIIVEKLTDQENFKVVLDDKELGLKYKNKQSNLFFSRWKDMNSIYALTDRTDKYLYELEMLEVWHFGLALQLRYFKLGNDAISQNSDDPNSMGVKSNIDSNVQTLISNFSIYLDEINNEKSYTIKGESKFADGLTKYFSELISIYPNANYSSWNNKIDLMLVKTQSEEIKKALQELKKDINDKNI